MLLRKTITYCLFILALFAFNCKTFHYCFKLSNGSIILIQDDYDCEEEKNSESEKSEEKNEKDEKKNFSEYLFSHKIYTLLDINRLSFIQQSKLLFATSDYSMAVFSPPEKAVI